MSRLYALMPVKASFTTTHSRGRRFVSDEAVQGCMDDLSCKGAHKVRPCAYNVRGLSHITCAILTTPFLPDHFVPTDGPLLTPDGQRWRSSRRRMGAPYVRQREDQRTLRALSRARYVRYAVV